MAIGLASRGGALELAALSHAAWFERLSRQASAIGNAVGEAVDQRVSLSWPALEGDSQRVIHPGTNWPLPCRALTAPTVVS